MKFPILNKILAVLILTTALISCDSQKPRTAILTIEAPINSAIWAVRLDSIGNKIGQNIEGSEVRIIALEINNSTEVRIESSTAQIPLRLYLSPGDSIHIKVPDSINIARDYFEISGPNSDFQNYLLRKDQHFKKLREDIWKATWDELPAVLSEYNLSLVQERKTTNFHKSLLSYDSLSDWSRIMDLELKKFMSISSYDTIMIRDLFASLLTYDQRLKGTFEFNDLIYDLQSMIINLNLWQNEDLTEPELLSLSIDRLNNLPVNPFIREWIAAVLLSQIRTYGVDGDLGLRFKKYLANENSPEVFVDDLKRRAQQWNHVKAGSPAPDLSLINLEGDTVKLSSYFGHYIYIDVWASWCRPCIEEFPFSTLAMLDTRFEDFKFLFVNMDPTVESWRNALERFEVPEGEQFYIPGQWNSEFFVKYNSTAIPRYLIIDPNGKIVNAHGPKPSQREKILVEIKEKSS